MADKCLICGDSLDSDEVVQVTRGLDRLTEASETRQDGLAEEFRQASSLKLHIKCRKTYTRPSSIKAAANKMPCSSTETDLQETPQLRSSLNPFNFKQDCLFCGEEASVKESLKQKVKYRKVVCEVRTLTYHTSVRSRAVERNDDWGKIVLGRIDSVIDLVAAEAKYHKTCSLHFFCKTDDSNKQTGSRPGRPEDPIKVNAFHELCNVLDTEDECQYSITELQSIMSQFLDGQEGYTAKHLKVKLKEHYKDRVTVTEGRGKDNIVSFRENINKIIHDKWYTERCSDMQQERRRIVETAAAIIREDIRMSVYECDAYPAVGSLDDDEHIVPESLTCFVEGVLKPNVKETASTNRKCISLKQAIISAVRPRSFISPVLLGIAVYLHRKYGSRDLINMLCNMGFAASYREVQRYEYSQIVSEQPATDLGRFVQFVFDNADFNVNTIDGHNTFHSMGGIKCVTPADVSTTGLPVPRILNPPKADVVGAFAKVPIKTYIHPESPGLQHISVKDIPIDSLPKPQTLTSALVLDSLWIAGCALEITPRPSWNGFMQFAMQQSGTYELSQLDPLPFINMDPSNLSTIYTALHFASTECTKHGIATCFVTFDQPLYIKATEIVAASEELSNVVVRLGGFHLLMSFMGAVGTIMSGSGLEDLWSSVYAKASIGHMMTGHAYSRALRAHFLTQEALATILFRTSDSLEDVDKEMLCTIYQNILRGDQLIDEIVKEKTILQLSQLLSQICDHAKSICRTAKLWIQYLEQVNIMRMFVRSERTGDWKLHIYCVKQMLPHLHAAGHLAYAKSAHLYIQQMEELADKMTPDEYASVAEKGFFTIRRTDKFWCGVWSDMTIEQVLMRSIKTSGGLTRGRGISESTLAQWVLALPLCVPMCISLEKFAGITPGTSEQHKEMLPSRQTRDNHDLDCFLEWFQVHPPFENRPSDMLVSLSTGIVADETINCDDAVNKGSLAMKHMVGQTFNEVKLCRKDKVKSIAAMNNTVKIREEEVTVNPNQLFNRITCVINSSSELVTFMKYELAPKAPSLFDDVSMRKPTKALLAELLESLSHPQNTLPDNTKFVVDGGYLLHVVVWPRLSTYDEICDIYVKYVSRHYKSNSMVIFDGYRGPPSTKSEEHKRRATNKSSADIMFTATMHTTTTQAEFLANAHNKARLIDALSVKFREAGIGVQQAVADADTLIVSTALELADDNDHNIVVVGTDTDLLVMLTARATDASNLYMLQPSKNNKPNKVFSINAIQESIGEMKECVLFLHAVTGCDSTSAIFRQGKKKAFKLIRTNPELARIANIFNSETVSKEDISAGGEKFLLALYGAAKFNTLDEYRYYAYKRAIASKTVSATFNLASLPPTSAAAYQHSLRTYLQVQAWYGNDLPPTEWGWQVSGNRLIPVATTLPAAPDKLMKLISCNCKTGCGTRCGCRRAGMRCSAMCSDCLGLGCSNASVTEDTDDVDDHVDE